jgi:hypothetical protein
LRIRSQTTSAADGKFDNQGVSVMALSESQIRQVIAAIYSIPELNQVAVGYYGQNICRQLSPGSPSSPNYGRRAVILEETPGSGVSIRTPVAPTPRPAPTGAAAPSRSEVQQGGQARNTLQTNGSRVLPELIGAGLSCGFAVIAGIGVVGSAAAEIPTVGASSILAVASYIGLATSSAQCLNGVVRFQEAVRHPNSRSLAELDNQDWYKVVTFVVDAAGVASGVAGLPQASRNLMAILERRAMIPAAGELATMNRARRTETISNAIQQASRNPETAEAVRRAVAEAVAAAGSGQRSIVGARAVAAAISQETARRLHRSLMEVISGYASLPINALPSSLVGSASGSINTTGGVILNVIGLSSD